MKRTPFEFHVFRHHGDEYRAKMLYGVLRALCYRRGPMHPWRKTSKAAIKSVWVSYINSVDKRREVA